jgi:hypothetical protein
MRPSEVAVVDDEVDLLGRPVALAVEAGASSALSRPVSRAMNRPVDASGSTSSQIRTSQKWSHSGRNAKTESTTSTACEGASTTTPRWSSWVSAGRIAEHDPTTVRRTRRLEARCFEAEHPCSPSNTGVSSGA